MTETEFEQAVVDLAHTFGWHAVGWRPAKTDKGWRTPVKYDGHGYPDLTLTHPRGRVIFAELKVGSNKPSPEQLEWAKHLAEVARSAPSAVRYRLWYPSCADEIAAVLSFGRLTSWKL